LICDDKNVGNFAQWSISDFAPSTIQDGIEEKIVEPLTLKYCYEEQMRNLLQSNGFKIVEEMGYYDRRPISEGPELIFICKKE